MVVGGGEGRGGLFLCLHPLSGSHCNFLFHLTSGTMMSLIFAFQGLESVDKEVFAVQVLNERVLDSAYLVSKAIWTIA